MPPERLAAETFRLPVERLREGHYSDAYFVLTKQLLEDVDHRPRVLMQVFQKQESVLGGIDEAIAGEPDAAQLRGVNLELVRRVRSALDGAGHRRVKIVCSGGFDAERIVAFEQAGAPVDAYGVGSSLIRGANDFTADIVLVEGEACAKVGRELRPNPRLSRVR